MQSFILIKQTQIKDYGHDAWHVRETTCSSETCMSMTITEPTSFHIATSLFSTH